MKVIKNDAYSAILDADSIREKARREGEAEGLARYLAAIDRFYAGAEPEMVRLATAIARKIVGEELRTSPEAIVAIVREALATVRQGKQIVIKVHPSAAALVRESVGADMRVVPSEGVAPGGCVIESEFGIVDAQLDTQLRVIERALGGTA
jgi:type III secretion protein L